MTGGSRPRIIGRHLEQELAKRVGGKRAGYGNLELPDVSTEAFDMEAKVMPLPAKLEAALITVTERGNKDKLPMVILKTKGDTWDRARVYMSFNEFMEWFGNGRNCISG